MTLLAATSESVGRPTTRCLPPEQQREGVPARRGGHSFYSKPSEEASPSKHRTSINAKAAKARARACRRGIVAQTSWIWAGLGAPGIVGARFLLLKPTGRGPTEIAASLTYGQYQGVSSSFTCAEKRTETMRTSLEAS